MCRIGHNSWIMNHISPQSALPELRAVDLTPQGLRYLKFRAFRTSFLALTGFSLAIGITVSVLVHNIAHPSTLTKILVIAPIDSSMFFFAIASVLVVFGPERPLYLSSKLAEYEKPI